MEGGGTDCRGTSDGGDGGAEGRKEGGRNYQEGLLEDSALEDRVQSVLLLRDGGVFIGPDGDNNCLHVDTVERIAGRGIKSEGCGVKGDGLSEIDKQEPHEREEERGDDELHRGFYRVMKNYVLVVAMGEFVFFAMDDFC